MADRIEDELGRLLEEATPGPWRTRGIKPEGDWWEEGCWLVVEQPDVEFGLHPLPVVGSCHLDLCAPIPEEADAALIAELRNAAPALLDVVRAAREVAQGGPCWYVVEHGGPPCPPDEPGCDACALRSALARLDAGGDELVRAKPGAGRHAPRGPHCTCLPEPDGPNDVCPLHGIEAQPREWGCTCPLSCDCQDYEAGFVSNLCPEHNLRPLADGDCEVHGESRWR